jgi:hypothetical protein
MKRLNKKIKMKSNSKKKKMRMEGEELHCSHEQ